MELLIIHNVKRDENAIFKCDEISLLPGKHSYTRFMMKIVFFSKNVNINNV
jgi:hypothetical protein